MKKTKHLKLLDCVRLKKNKKQHGVITYIHSTKKDFEIELFDNVGNTIEVKTMNIKDLIKY